MPRPPQQRSRGLGTKARRRAAPLPGLAVGLAMGLAMGLSMPTASMAVPVIDFPGPGVVNPTVLLWHDDDLPAGPFSVLLGLSPAPGTPMWSGLTVPQQVLPALPDGHYFWRVTDALGASAVSDFYAVTGQPPTAPVSEPGSLWLWLLGLAGLAGLRHRPH